MRPCTGRGPPGLAYWDLVYGRAAVGVQRQALALAEQLVAANRARVEVETMAPIDVVQAQSEAAARRQLLALAVETQRTAELVLKELIVGGTSGRVVGRRDQPDGPAADRGGADPTAGSAPRGARPPHRPSAAAPPQPFCAPGFGPGPFIAGRSPGRVRKHIPPARNRPDPSTHCRRPGRAAVWGSETGRGAAVPVASAPCTPLRCPGASGSPTSSRSPPAVRGRYLRRADSKRRNAASRAGGSRGRVRPADDVQPSAHLLALLTRRAAVALRLRQVANVSQRRSNHVARPEDPVDLARLFPAIQR